MFTRRHYEAIATMLKTELTFYRTVADEKAIATVESVIIRHADLFEADNPNFKRGLFMRACGVYS